MSTSAESSEYVTLVSSDNYEFIIHRRSTFCSETVRKMLDSSRGGFVEGATARCKFENIYGIILQKVVEYMVYNEKNAAVEGVADMPLDSESVLEVLVAADYLGI